MFSRNPSIMHLHLEYDPEGSPNPSAFKQFLWQIAMDIVDFASINLNPSQKEKIVDNWIEQNMNDHLKYTGSYGVSLEVTPSKISCMTHGTDDLVTLQVNAEKHAFLTIDGSSNLIYVPESLIGGLLQKLIFQIHPTPVSEGYATPSLVYIISFHTKLPPIYMELSNPEFGDYELDTIPLKKYADGFTCKYCLSI